MASTVPSQSNRATLVVVEQEILIMDVQPTNVEQLCDTIMPTWMFPGRCWVCGMKN